MSLLKDKLNQTIPAMRDEIKSLVKEHGDKVIDKVTIGQVFGGMRGIKSLVCDTSEVPPDRGLLIRGVAIGDLADRLPEEIFFFMLTGVLPTAAELVDLQADLTARSTVPDYVWTVMEAMPKDTHPMAAISILTMALERESKFRAGYDAGMKKDEYWVPTLEDMLDMMAKLPAIAAGIYRWRFDKGPRIAAKPGLDWSSNYAHMMGLPDPDGSLAKAMQLYMTLHSDHESGNVSAHVCHNVGSALSDPYYAVTAAWNGLAGPLHGLANQECLAWVIKVKEMFGGAPTKEALHKFAWDTLNSGKVIPGYGHAVLRITDPRFDAFRAFGKKHLADDPIFQIVDMVFEVVPPILVEQGKAKDPWPNVDAGSGSILYHYGLTEFSYYTVLFAISRAWGIGAQLVLSRGWGEPIERPKSLPTATYKKLATAV